MISYGTLVIEQKPEKLLRLFFLHFKGHNSRMEIGKSVNIENQTWSAFYDPCSCDYN